MAQCGGTGWRNPLHLPLLLLWASIKQDLHFVKATQANVTSAPDHQLNPLNQTEQHNITYIDIHIYYSYYASWCWHEFNDTMNNMTEPQWCQWEHIRRPYSDFRNCTETLAEKINYPYPNEQADAYILLGHEMFFFRCKSTSIVLNDPPDDILLTLILFPILLLPFLVTLVVWKSKNGELQT